MRLMFIILLVFCWIGGSSAIRHGFVENEKSSTRKRAIILIPQPVQTLGQISDRKVWQMLFSVQNQGNARIVLNESDLECGCGENPKRTLIIPPGETMQIAVPLDTRFSAGPVENRVSFTTNDPTQPRITLTARAFVATPAEQSPAHTAFGQSVESTYSGSLPREGESFNSENEIARSVLE